MYDKTGPPSCSLRTVRQACRQTCASYNLASAPRYPEKEETAAASTHK